MDKERERLGRLPSGKKVVICMDMSDACVGYCAEGIRAQNPDISEEELAAKLRHRLAWSKRRRQQRGR